MSEVENENEKWYAICKIVILSITSFVIGLFAIFFLAVSKVNAVTIGSINVNYYTWDWQLGGGVSCNDVPCDLSLNSASDSSLALSNYAFEVALNQNTWATASFNYVIQYDVIYRYGQSVVVNLDPTGIKYYWYYSSSSNNEITTGCSTTATQSVRDIGSYLREKKYSITSICTLISPSANSSQMYIRIPAPSTSTSTAWALRQVVVNSADRTYQAKSEVTDTTQITQSIQSQTESINNNINANTDKINEKQDETNEKLDDIESAITDESEADYGILDDIEPSSDTPISDLLLLPISIIQQFLTRMNQTCQSYSFGELYGTNLQLTCTDITKGLNKLSPQIKDYIDLFMSFFMYYNIFMLFVSAWDGFTSLRDEYESLAYAHAPGSSAYSGEIDYEPRHGG